MAFYRARIQMALKVHDDATAVVEAEIELPDFYQLLPGSWLKHPYLDDNTPIMGVGYDATIGRPIAAMAAGAQDPSVTVDEWLEHHPHWKIAESPTIEIKKITLRQQDQDPDYPPMDDDNPPPPKPTSPFSAN